MTDLDKDTEAKVLGIPFEEPHKAALCDQWGKKNKPLGIIRYRFQQALEAVKQWVLKRIQILRICNPLGKDRRLTIRGNVIPSIIIAGSQSRKQRQNKHQSHIRQICPKGITVSGGAGRSGILFGAIRQHQRSSQKHKQLYHKQIPVQKIVMNSRVHNPF